MKKCPFCAEEIQDEAVICRYCGRNLSGSIQDQEQIKKNLGCITSPTFAVIGGCIFGWFVIFMIEVLKIKIEDATKILVLMVAMGIGVFISMVAEKRRQKYLPEDEKQKENPKSYLKW